MTSLQPPRKSREQLEAVGGAEEPSGDAAVLAAGGAGAGWPEAAVAAKVTKQYRVEGKEAALRNVLILHLGDRDHAESIKI